MKGKVIIIPTKQILEEISTYNLMKDLLVSFKNKNDFDQYSLISIFINIVFFFLAVNLEKSPDDTVLVSNLLK